MFFVDSWATADKRVLLSLSATVTDVFMRHVQIAQSDCETGGLLLGTVHGANLLIVEATTHTSQDKRFRFFFERSPFGHQDVAQARWNDSGGTVRYLGEWHTHPEDHPHPSALDQLEWRKLATQRKDKRPLLALIVGRKSLYLALVPALGKAQVLISNF